MDDLNYGAENEQLLKNFRQICSSHIQVFKSTKNHIRSLLGNSYHYQSGIFRESLLRNFLINILPKSLSVDTGFIYGFDEFENSKQIDILIWNSYQYSPIYKTNEFVIVPPESVVAAIEVKSTLNKKELIDGIKNLLSIAKLDIQFREKIFNQNSDQMLPPIGKFLITYKLGTKPQTVIDNISAFYKSEFESSIFLCEELIPTLNEMHPILAEQKHKDKFDRIFPKLVTAIENKNGGFYRGYGPADDIIQDDSRLPLKRLPYYYHQKSNITTPFEKFISELLYIIFRTLETKGWSTMYAWSDLHPSEGVRIGDISEIDIESGRSLLDVNKINYYVNN